MLAKDKVTEQSNGDHQSDESSAAGSGEKDSSEGGSAAGASMPYPLVASLQSLVYGLVWLGATFVARQNFPSEFMTTSRFFNMNIAQR